MQFIIQDCYTFMRILGYTTFYFQSVIYTKFKNFIKDFTNTEHT